MTPITRMSFGALDKEVCLQMLSFETTLKSPTFPRGVFIV